MVGMNISIEVLFGGMAVLLILSAVASKLSDRLGVPALLVFLLIGILAGSEGVGGIYFDNPFITQWIGFFALAVILFSGGLDTKADGIRSVFKEGLTLATAGVFITAAVVGLAAHWLLSIPLLEGMLIGAITSSTDAAAVFAVLRSQGVRLKGRLSALLEFESGSNDPMAVFLTIGFIQLIQSPEQSGWSLLLLFAKQMLVGGVAGVLFGKLLLVFINRLRLGYDGLYPVLTLGVVLLAFAATTFLGGSSFLAVYLMGLTLGREDFLHKRSLSRFYDGLAWLFQIVMFLTLGLFVFPTQLLPVALPGLLLALVLIFVARPFSIVLTLLPFRFTGREKLFISWVGLRGAVPIILATYPQLAGMEDSGLIFNVVFFVVISSVLIQGTTLTQMARWLKLDDSSPAEPQYPLEATYLHGWKGVLQEVVVRPGSAVEQKAVFEMKLPSDYLIVLVARGDQFLIPNGSLVLQAQDRVLGLAKVDTHQKVRQIFEA